MENKPHQNFFPIHFSLTLLGSARIKVGVILRNKKGYSM